jgi:hypothetical protein
MRQWKQPGMLDSNQHEEQTREIKPQEAEPTTQAEKQRRRDSPTQPEESPRAERPS